MPERTSASACCSSASSYCSSPAPSSSHSSTSPSTSAPPGIFLARPAEPLAGIRLAVKDLFDTAGLTTTYGSAIFRDHVPGRTAEAVLRLEAAGYVNAGKTNLHEFAYGITSVNPHFGTVPNPVAPGRMAGGSSGGSAAALAAGLADAALGSDSGGSIRIPAACCGVVGFKPTHGLVPLDGCFPLAPSFDHAGPMATSVRGCTAMMEALVPELRPLQIEALDEIAVAIAWLDLCEPLVRERVAAAAAHFPRRRTLELPLPEGIGAVFMREAAGVHRELFAAHADRYGENVRTKIERCLAVTDDEYEAGLRARERYRARLAEAVEEDLLVTPTLAFVAPPLPVDDLVVRDAVIRFTYPINILGWPALALPCGPAEGGLPASVQLVGRPGDDALVLAVGEALEVAL
ncbi:MAG: amidase [Thermoleophilia bacterium]|nr:amidase [Thermoleophilia bacterium]